MRIMIIPGARGVRSVHRPAERNRESRPAAATIATALAGDSTQVDDVAQGPTVAATSQVQRYKDP
jgi:hypothetical protein